MQSYNTHNSIYNPKSMKISIGAFNKSIDYLHAITSTKPKSKPKQSLLSLNHTLKQHSSINHFPKQPSLHHHSSVNNKKDKDNNPNTNYIINNFTLSTKNISNSHSQMPTEPNDPGNNQQQQQQQQQHQRIETLCQLISNKDKQIELLNQKLKVKDIIIKEQREKIEVINKKYYKMKREYAGMKEEKEELRKDNGILRAADRDLKEILKLVEEKKVYVEVSEDKEGSEMLFMLFDDYFYNKDNNRNKNKVDNDTIEDNNLFSINSSDRIECESASFTPLNIDPVKSLKRLEVIPKLNFNKLHLRTEINHEEDKEKKGKKAKQKRKVKEIDCYNNKVIHKPIINNDNNTIEDQTKDSNMNLNVNQIKHQPNIELNHNKISIKHFFNQSYKSKSFSGKISKVIKQNIFNNIQHKYDIITNQFK